MGDWSSLEKILTGGAVALGLSVAALWRIWGRYTLVADRENKFKDENIERLIKALTDTAQAINSLTVTVASFNALLVSIASTKPKDGG